jgi:hypothetical protein
MSEAESNHGNAAVKWLFEVIGAGFIAEAIGALFRREFATATIAFCVGLLLGVVGLRWVKMKPMLPERIVTTATHVATDVRWWLLVLGCLFFYLGSPGMIEAWRAPIDGLSQPKLALVPTAVQSSSSPPVPFTSYDLEKRERAIDAALPIFETELSTLTSEGDRLALNALGESPEEHARSLEKLRIYQENARKTFSKILKIRENNKQYDDIYRSLSAPDDFLIAVQNLIDVVILAGNQASLTKEIARSQASVLSKYADIFAKSVHNLNVWAERETNNLTEYRKRTFH